MATRISFATGISYSLQFLCLMVIGPAPLYAQQFGNGLENPFGITTTVVSALEIPNRIIFTDWDSDGDKDFFLFKFDIASIDPDNVSAFDFDHIIHYQENTGTPQSPEYNSPADALDDLEQFYGLFLPTFGDLDGDGQNDIAAMASVDTFGEAQHMQLYLSGGLGGLQFNTSRADSFGVSECAPKSWLTPELVDLDNDGDLDLLLSGVTANALNNNIPESTCLMARNEGTPEIPEFTSWFVNAFNSKQDTAFETMTAGDIDNDGDIDLLGIANSEERTKLFFHENVPQGNNVMQFADYTVSPFGLPNPASTVGFISADLTDIDDDGDLDLFLLTRDGDTETWQTIFYENDLCAPVNSRVEISICEGESYMIDGIAYDQPGTYNIETNTSNGCDSLIELALEIFPTTASDITAGICAGESFEFNNQTLSDPGSYMAILTGSNNCDSIVTLALEVYPSDESMVSGNYCDGDIIEIGGQSITATGTYNFNLVNAYGCDSVVLAELTFHNPQVGIMVDGESIVADFNASGYSWIDCGSGDTIMNTEVPVFSPAADGSYRVKIEDAFGCSAISECIDFVTTSIREPDWGRALRVYPNPAVDFITVEIISGEQIVSVDLISVDGSTIFRANPRVGETTLHLSDIVPGAYVLKVSTETDFALRRVIIADH